MNDLGEPIGFGRTAEVFAWRPGVILKLLRPGFPDAVGEHEASVAEALTRAGLAAPRFVGTERVDGRFGLLYEQVAGPSMLDVMSRQPWRIDRLARQFAALHAAMHATTAPGLPRLKDNLRTMMGRAGDRLTVEAREAALTRLAELPDGEAACHGDMHPGNVVLTKAGPCVLDWMTAGTGSPAADVARTLMLLKGGAVPDEMPRVGRWLVGAGRRRFSATYLRRYLELRPVPRAELARWRLPILAARLGERIEPEREVVLAQIARELARS